jgi:hypothetical protein
MSEKSKATRFKKGQSGNKNGRPKGSKNRATTAEAEINEKIVVTENGERKKITKWHAGFKHIVNNAAMGDSAAFKLVEATIERLGIDRLSNQASKESEEVQNQEPLTLEEASRMYNEEIKGDKPSQ